MAIEHAGEALILIPEFSHLDTLNAEQFTENFGAEAAKAACIAIDLSRVQFVDSSGLGSILGLIQEAHGRGAHVAIFGARPPVRVLFRMVQLAQLLPIVDTKEEALARLST